jgi:hypothetical protein
MPAIFFMNLFGYVFSTFFGPKRRRSSGYPRSHNLRLRLYQRPYLTRKKNMAFLRRHYLPALAEHQLWIFKRHGPGASSFFA